jgi:hypothetical protein
MKPTKTVMRKRKCGNQINVSTKKYFFLQIKLAVRNVNNDLQLHQGEKILKILENKIGNEKF